MSVKTITTLDDAQISDLHRLYQREWWTKGREMSSIRRMLSNSDVTIGLVDGTADDLIAFARALTDGVYKAIIFDVIVHREYRNSGLGRRLMEDLLGHPELQDVQHWELYCLEPMVPFYERWGFTDELGDLRLMRRE